MFCKNCGKEIPNNSSNCQFCGATIQNNNDTGNVGWAFLGCCIPIVGLVLFLVWKDEKPLNAKNCLIGFIIGFVLSIVSSILYIVTLTGGILMYA